MNPFDYVRAINEKREVPHLYDFNPFLAIGSLSYSLDTVMLANEMNRFPNLHPDLQYVFLYEAVRKGKRFQKWHKPVVPAHVDAVMEYYDYSHAKALEALQVLTQDNIRDILRELDHGGR
jgi:hypothetical protein